jgi:hypothetical protein
MGKTPWAGKNYVHSNQNHTAVYVSWDDAQAFINKLNVAAGPYIVCRRRPNGSIQRGRGRKRVGRLVMTNVNWATSHGMRLMRGMLTCDMGSQ